MQATEHGLSGQGEGAQGSTTLVNGAISDSVADTFSWDLTVMLTIPSQGQQRQQAPNLARYYFPAVGAMIILSIPRQLHRLGHHRARQDKYGLHGMSIQMMVSYRTR
jgi:hypothetical protein